MVDYIANSAEDLHIDSFQFKIPPGASYVTDRRSVSLLTVGSNIYQSGSGTRVIRVNTTGDGWLGPSTVRLHYTLVNNDGTAAHRLRPIFGPWSFFRRVLCLVGGALVDDIDYYNLVHEMLHICTSTEIVMTLKDSDTDGIHRKIGILQQVMTCWLGYLVFVAEQ